MGIDPRLTSITQPDSEAELSEERLWQVFRAGNKQAYAVIYERYVPMLLSYGRKMTTDAPRIEDAIQDLFIELWKGRANLSPTTSIQFYLFRALRNKLSRLQRIPSEENINDSLAHENLLSVPLEEEWIAEEEASERAELLRNAIGQLSQRQQEAIHLRYYQHFDSRQIADLMNINDQSVRNLLHIALRSLKQLLAIGLICLAVSLFV